MKDKTFVMSFELSPLELQQGQMTATFKSVWITFQKHQSQLVQVDVNLVF
jgi:hypothetical protein